tara:strand:+ start:291 stop:437 length:147 start_codon:yes stop_codon:yes gene_type:complete
MLRFTYLVTEPAELDLFALDELAAAVTGKGPVVAGGGAGGNEKGTDVA